MPTPGQGRSTHSTGSAARFREWLQAQLDHYNWSYGDLAKQMEVSKGAVVRWMQTDDVHTSRRPSYESLRRLSELFGVDLAILLDYAGVETDEGETGMTTLQRETAAIVATMPDAILAVLSPQIRALATEGQRQKTLDTIKQSLDETP